jgi:hypothetical protein
MDDPEAARGRKVFFLYPHSVLNEELLIEILSHEYEVYCLRNHEAAVKVLESNPGSILFVNIDDTLKELQWERWIRRLVSRTETAATRVGIMTYNPDAALARKYLMEMMLPCGFIQLKLGLAEGKRIILKTLEANEARGRRRYVRAQCADPKKASFNMKVDDRLYSGAILDLSAAGMTFRFDEPMDLKANRTLPDIQLRMKGTLCRVSGSYRGVVRGASNRHLMLFESPLPEEPAEKIHRFIFHSLQEQMEEFVRSAG